MKPTTMVDNARRALQVARTLDNSGVEVYTVNTTRYSGISVQVQDEDGVDTAAGLYGLDADDGETTNYTRGGDLGDGTSLRVYSPRDRRPRCACGRRCDHSQVTS